MKQKALVFYSYLPPWRVDVFNEMAKMYDLTIIFLNYDSEGFTYNKKQLLGQLSADTVFWNKGFKIKSKAFRFGINTLINKYKPDIVFSHEYTPTSIFLSLFLKFKLFKFRLCITTSDNLSIATSAPKVRKQARSFVLSSAEKVICYSNEVKNWYSSTYPKLKTAICPNIQNPETLLSHRGLFPPIIEKYKNEYKLHNNKVILFTGRLVNAKGLDLLLKAFSMSENDGYKLVIVGEGKEKANLQNIVNTLNIQDRVVFPGYFDSTELYAWYDLADIFILPSRFEPFGAVVNEALVYGCPVLVSKYIGALDFIDESNGYIFNPLNEEEFISALNFATKKLININSTKKNLMKYSFHSYIDAFVLSEI